MRRAPSWSVAILLVAWVSLASALSFAQEGDPPAARRAEPRRSSDPETAQKLGKLYDAYQDGRKDEARRRGSELLRSRLSPFERGIVERVLADVDQEDGRLADAREHLQRALASEGLNDSEADTVRYQLVRILFGEERWREAIDAWREWERTTPAPPSAQAYYELAVAYCRIEDFTGALEPAGKAVALSKRPNETYLQLLLFVHLQQGSYRQAAPLLRALIDAAPLERNHWVQLAAVDSQLGNDAEAAQSLQIAYYGGSLKEPRDVRLLAQLLVQIGIPYRAARILSAEIESRRLEPDAKLYAFLGESWILAQEYGRAIDPLTEAARLSGDGNLYVRVAQLHAQSESWKDVVGALRVAIAKGRLTRPGDACLLLGIALHHVGNDSESRPWLERALEDESSRASARSWLDLLDGEKTSAPAR